MKLTPKEDNHPHPRQRPIVEYFCIEPETGKILTFAENGYETAIEHYKMGWVVYRRTTSMEKLYEHQD